MFIWLCKFLFLESREVSMKKRLIALLLCMTMTVAMTACGGKDGDSAANTESTEVVSTEEKMPVTDLAKYEFNYTDYVTLCDYSAIPVELAEDYVITEEDVDHYVREIFAYYGPFYVVDETKTVVEEGDIVNVDYVGKLDGVAFEGGTAPNQNLDVSGNCAAGGYPTYIDGFTAGLLGAEVGSEVDCDVTFPENYGSADLAGKAVVFTFTVNAIQREMTFEEVDDAFVQENFSMETVDAFVASVRETLETDSVYYKMQDSNTDVQQYLLDNCTVEIPADYFADLMTAYKTAFVWQNCNGDEAQLEEYLSTNYNYTIDQAEEEWREYLTLSIKLEFILSAIAEEMGVELDVDAYESDLADTLGYYGLATADALYESAGYGDVAYGEKMLKQMHLQSDLLEKLVETATITVAEPVEE